jgi:hypothetical protein
MYFFQDVFRCDTTKREIETDIASRTAHHPEHGEGVKGATYIILKMRIAYSDMFLDDGNIRKSM